jgi:uncharacterized protein (DUF736 family)
MATIGTLTLKANGSFVGQIDTLAINAPLVLQPIIKSSDNAPDFRIFSGRAEVGAGWKKIGRESQSEYVSITLESPDLPKKILANLGKAAGQDDPDVYAIIWNA